MGDRIDGHILGFAQVKALVAALFAISLPCFGSTVVVWLTTEGIVAAADSLELASDRLSVTQPTVCKIPPLGGYYFASTGYTRMELAGGKEELLYSSKDVAQAVAQDSKGIDEFTSKFIGVMKQKLTTAMTASLKADRRYFMSEINGKGGALSATVFGIEEDQPKVAIIAFTITAATSSEVRVQESVQRCPGTQGCDLERGIFAQLGIRDFMGPKLEPNPPTLVDAVPWAAALIQAEIDGDQARSERQKAPRKVGSPIAILTIRPSGAQWADGYQGACPNLEK